MENVSHHMPDSTPEPPVDRAAPAAVERLLAEYVGAWSEPDPSIRRGLLAAAWAEDGAYADPLAEAQGRAALDALIDRFLHDNPGARFTLNGKIAHHHGYVRFYWTLHLSGGAQLEGMDFGEIGADGRLARIVGFF